MTRVNGREELMRVNTASARGRTTELQESLAIPRAHAPKRPWVPEAKCAPSGSEAPPPQIQRERAAELQAIVSMAPGLSEPCRRGPEGQCGCTDAVAGLCACSGASVCAAL